MTCSIEDKIAKKKQAIARKQDEIARLKKQKEKQENGMKFVVAGAVLVEAKKNPIAAKWLYEIIEQNVTREADKKRVMNLINELKQVIANS